MTEHVLIESFSITDQYAIIEKDIREILNFQDAIELGNISPFPEINFSNALLDLERGESMIYYEEKRQFTLQNISILEEVGDYYKFTISLTRREDIFTNFESNVKFKITYDDYIYPENNYFNSMLIKNLAPLSRMRIHFYLDKNDLPQNFYIKYRVYILSLEKSKELALESYRTKIIAGNCVYWKGSIFKFL